MDSQVREEYNQMVRKWTSMVKRKLTGSAGRFRHGKSGMVTRGKGWKSHPENKLDNSMKHKTHQSFGEIDSVGFQFERHGVFVHKGVGRGYEMQSGMVVRTAKSKPANVYHTIMGVRVTFGSLDILNQRSRKPVEWFNPILDEYLPELADKVAEMKADAVFNSEWAKIR